MKVNWFLLVGVVLICNLIGALGTIWTSSDSDWYRKLNKPSFNPPAWVFGPVWTILFSLMGVALYLVWISPVSRLRTIGLVLFGVQFVLNVVWSYLFFGLNNPLWSLIEIGVLLIGILIAIGISNIANSALGESLFRIQINYFLLFGAVLFSFVVGVLSGVLPAIQASKLKVVEVLRG